MCESDVAKMRGGDLADAENPTPLYKQSLKAGKLGKTGAHRSVWSD